jgi:hypothetical protein
MGGEGNSQTQGGFECQQKVYQTHRTDSPNRRSNPSLLISENHLMDDPVDLEDHKTDPQVLDTSSPGRESQNVIEVVMSLKPRFPIPIVATLGVEFHYIVQLEK